MAQKKLGVKDLTVTKLGRRRHREDHFANGKGQDDALQGQDLGTPRFKGLAEWIRGGMKK